jgi:hypothetical protein
VREDVGGALRRARAFKIRSDEPQTQISLRTDQSDRNKDF